MGLTRDEIIAKWDGLTPRERDAWVAEVVFGWTPFKDGRMRSSDGFMIRAIPEYTTEIFEAWSVFDSFEYGTITRMDFAYRANIRGIPGFAAVFKPIAPEAICLAAIIASLQSDECATKLAPNV